MDDLESIIKSRKFWRGCAKKAKGSKRKLINRHIRELGERIRKNYERRRNERK